MISAIRAGLGLRPTLRSPLWTFRRISGTDTLSTTETYLAARPEDVIRRVQAHQQASPVTTAPNAVGWTYEADDLAALLGPNTP